MKATVKIRKDFLVKSGRWKRGDQVVVAIDTAANVLLVNDSGLAAFKRMDDFEHYGDGGYFTSSPAVFVVPFDDDWHIIVDLPNGGTISASVQVIPNC